MQIYYTPLTAAIFQSDSTPIVERLMAFLSHAAALGGQIELLHPTEHEGDFEIHWIALRISGAGRLIGAVVRDRTHNTHSFFALEVTEHHDYRKTLAHNPQRRQNWRYYMRDFLQTNPAPSIETCPQQVFQHDRRFQVPHPVQAALFDIPLHKGIVCFAPPGAGKTLLGIQRGMAYVKQQGKRTLFLTPSERLKEAFHREFCDLGTVDQIALSTFWSFNDFLITMNAMLPSEHRWENFKDDERKRVDFAFFKDWCLKRPRSKRLTEEEIMKRWQELLYVILKPNWDAPTAPFITEEHYLNLGHHQTYFSKEDRIRLYQDVFMPFLASVDDVLAFYFPPMLAFHLYQELISHEMEPLCDAFVLDEMQRFHPWELGCLFHVLKMPLVCGQYFICGDAHQGADIQQPRVAESLRFYFEHLKIELPIYHLSVNYRNKEAIGRYVAQIRAVELHFLGSMEHATHVEMGLNQDSKGCVVMSTPEEIRIDDDAEAYVVMPDDTWRERTKALWKESQIVTLKEFAGLSAKKLVMFGFSEHFQESLNVVYQDLPEGDAFPKWDKPQFYSRKSRIMDARLRICFQSIFTAASRAIDELILVEMPGKKPHPLFLEMQKHAAMMEPTKPQEEPVISSPKEWFLRAQKDFENGLEENARKIFQEDAIWGHKAVESMTLMMKDKPLTHAFFESAEALLFPCEVETRVSPSHGGGGGGGSSITPLKMQVKVERKTSSPVDGELTPAIEPIFKALESDVTEESLKKAMDEAKLANEEIGIPELLLTRKMTNGDCLLVHMVAEGNGETFLEKLGKNRWELKEAYDALEKPNIRLQLCWRVLVTLDERLGKIKSKRISSLQDRIQKVCESTELMRELLITEAGMKLLALYWKFFAHSPKFSKNLYVEVRKDDKSISPFYKLSTYHIGRAFVIEHWEELKAHPKFLTSFYTVVREEGAYQGTSPFFWFAVTFEGRAFVIDHWEEFKTHRDLKTSMHTVITGEDRRGESPFFWFAATVEGRAFVIEHWEEFKTHPELETSMHTMIPEGPNQGQSPFFWFAITPKGRAFVIDHWEEFKTHRDLKTSMHTVITGEDRRGESPFFWFAATVEGRAFVIEHWEEFKTHPELETSMHTMISEGPNQGQSPFFWFAGSPEGRAFVIEHWEEFKTHRDLKTSMHTVITGEERRGESPFYWFTMASKGLAFVIEHWEEFKTHRDLKTSMHSVITGEVRRGESPFFWFAGNPEGRALIIDQWEEFKTHPDLKTSMHSVITREESRGESPFFWFTVAPEGRAFIIDHWEEFKTHRDLKTSMHSVITGEVRRGESPLFLFAANPEGREFIIQRWDDFKALGLFSEEKMERTITVGGSLTGKTYAEVIHSLDLERRQRLTVVSAETTIGSGFRLYDASFAETKTKEENESLSGKLKI